MAYSSLNSDRYRKHKVPSPPCALTLGECFSVTRFFFICPNYTVTHERYLEGLHRNHTTQELLFGKDISTDEALFLKVQDYILRSKRLAQ